MVTPYAIWLSAQIARLEAKVACYRRIETGRSGQRNLIDTLELVIAGMRSRLPPEPPPRVERAAARVSHRITSWRGGWGSPDMDPPLGSWLAVEADRLEGYARSCRDCGDWLDLAAKLEARARIYRAAATAPDPLQALGRAPGAPAVERPSRLQEIIRAAAEAPPVFGSMPAPFAAGEQLGLFG